MKKLSVLFTLLFLVMLVASASAIDKTGKIAIGGYAGYSFGFGDVFKKYEYGYYSTVDYSSQFKVTSSLGVKIKYGLTENIAFSLALNYQRTKNEWKFMGEKESNSGHWPAFLANGIIIPLPEGNTCPYLTGGVGLYIHYEKYYGSWDSNTKPGINLGGGVEQFLQDNIALDGGARLHLIFTEDKMTTYIQIYAGVNFYPF